MTRWFSLIGLSVLVIGSGVLFGAEAQTPWPLWDGEESIAHYASRVHLPPTNALDLGGGIKLDLVLIPAGQFVMGVPEPEPVNENRFRVQIIVAQALVFGSVAILLTLLGAIVLRAVRRRSSPQYSLVKFIGMVVIAGIGVLSGAHWRHTSRALEQAKADYPAALARYKQSYLDEKPAHAVVLTRPFYMGKYEVTQEQYQRVMGVNPSQFKGEALPVERVSWNQAQEFCASASRNSGQMVRLPTEAEWEYACRAGSRADYHAGDAVADLDRAGWYSGNSQYTTHPVGQKAPNAWDLYDMHGNVGEWCQDWWQTYSGEVQADPNGPTDGHHRQVRGGCWHSCSDNCRSGSRIAYPPAADYHNSIGFRVVVSVSRSTP